MFDVLDPHVFGYYFFVLCKHESYFALLFVDENFEQIHKFPCMRHKNTFVSALEYVKVTSCESDLTFYITNDRLPQSSEPRRGFLIVVNFDFDQFFRNARDLPASLILRFQVEHWFAFDSVRLEKLDVFEWGFTVGFGEWDGVFELDLFGLLMFLWWLFVEIQVWGQSRVEDFCTDLRLFVFMRIIPVLFYIAQLLQLLLSLHFIWCV